MADEHKAKRLEIAHVLFMDIVGYSKLLTDEQSEALQELNQIVRSTEAAREAEAAGALTVLPKTYDRAVKDIFAVESEVAQEIADSLKAKLSPAEANTVASAPTKDTQAYDLFLKGEFEQRVANSNFRSESFDQAARWYKEAIARDPEFALAIAQLAICQLRRHWLTDPLSEAEVMEAGRMAKQVVTLAPDLAEAHVALGLFHYYGFRDYEPALTVFRRAIELQPNNALAL